MSRFNCRKFQGCYLAWFRRIDRKPYLGPVCFKLDYIGIEYTKELTVKCAPLEDFERGEGY